MSLDKSRPIISHSQQVKKIQDVSKFAIIRALCQNERRSFSSLFRFLHPLFNRLNKPFCRFNSSFQFFCLYFIYAIIVAFFAHSLQLVVEATELNRKDSSLDIIEIEDSV